SSMNQRSRLSKIRRIQENCPPRGLDLFSGCGGFSLGFVGAGCNVVGAVAVDPLAAKSPALNFCKDLTAKQLEIHGKPRDITRVEPEELMHDLCLGRPADAIDVIIGGPPCQAFARVGRAKLREIASHPRAFLKDPRGNLYLRFLKYVEK